MKAFKANSRDRDSSCSDEEEADTILRFLRRGLTEEIKVAERQEEGEGEGEDDDKKEMREE